MTIGEVPQWTMRTSNPPLERERINLCRWGGPLNVASRPVERDLIAKSHYLIDPGDIICSAKIQPSAKDTQAIFNSLISDPFLPAANSWLDLHFEYDLLRHPAMISGSCRTSPLSSPLTPFQSPPQSVFPPTTTIPPPPTKHPPVCGSIRVVYDGTLHSKALCHCSDCRKISGGAYSVNLLVPTSALVLESGTPRSYTKDTDEGNRFTSFFCRDCGSTVWRESTGIPVSSVEGVVATRHSCNG